MIDLNRRSFIKGSLATLAALLCPKSLWAMGEEAQVAIALLGEENLRPTAVEQLMWEIRKRTSMDVREKPVLIQPESPHLYEYPLLVWIGDGPFEPLSEARRQALSRYLRAGGTLFIDDASLRGDDRFDQGIRSEIAALWPDRPLNRTSNDHTIFRSFYLLEHPYGRMPRQQYLESVEYDDRTPLIYGRNDLFGAMGRDPLGHWLLPMEGSEHQRELAFRMGLNLLMYATCSHYKRDQVHTLAIMRRRRWRVDP